MSANLPSLGTNLDGAFAKVRRADRHIRTLKQSLKGFTQRHPYAIGVEEYHSNVIKPEVNVRRPRLVLPGRIPPKRGIAISSIGASVTLTPKVAPPLVHWSVIVGDVVSNLSSALDNLVWELALLNEPHWPSAPSTRKWMERNVGFPYTKDPANWSSNVNRYLGLLDPALLTVFEEAQPSYVGQHMGDDLQYHPLWVLHELWNRDKHRAINLVAAFVEMQVPTISMPAIFPDVPQLKTQVLTNCPQRTLEGKTEVAVIRIYFPKQIEIRPEFDVKMDTKLRLTVLFGQGAPGKGRDVLATLKSARDEVFTFLSKFR